MCGLFSSCREGGLLSSCGALISHCGGFSWCATRILESTGVNSFGMWTLQFGLLGSRAQTHELWRGGLSCPMACGNLPGPGIKPCLLHWQADSLSLSQHSTVLRLVVLSSFCRWGNWSTELLSNSLKVAQQESTGVRFQIQASHSSPLCVIPTWSMQAVKRRLLAG